MSYEMMLSDGHIHGSFLTYLYIYTLMYFTLAKRTLKGLGRTFKSFIRDTVYNKTSNDTHGSDLIQCDFLFYGI